MFLTSSDGGGLAILLVFLIGATIYFLPTIVAFQRGHGYKVVILVMNLFAFTGILWLASMIWAVFPAEKALIDPVVGNFTGTGTRNSGDAIGNARFGNERGYAAAGGSRVSDGVLDELNKLADLRSKGAITDAEFEAMKAKLLGRR